MISRIDIEDMTDAQDEARAIAEAAQITMTYRNWRGEVAQRTIRPVALWFGKTEWHPEPGWLLNAWDCDKGERRDFALADCQFADLVRPSQAGGESVAREAGRADGWAEAARFLETLKGADLNGNEFDLPADEWQGVVLRGVRACADKLAALAAMDTPKGGGQ